MKVVITNEQLKAIALRFPILTVLEYINRIKGGDS